MTRREEVERIILGTILNGREVLGECIGSITSDMFSVYTNRKIYEKVLNMRDNVFCEISPYDLVAYDGSMAEYAAYMVELANEYDFELNKLHYNLKLYASGVKNPRYTRVTFSDYITRFIQLYVESFKS